MKNNFIVKVSIQYDPQGSENKKISMREVDEQFNAAMKDFVESLKRYKYLDETK